MDVDAPAVSPDADVVQSLVKARAESSSHFKFFINHSLRLTRSLRNSQLIYGGNDVGTTGFAARIFGAAGRLCRGAGSSSA